MQDQRPLPPLSGVGRHPLFLILPSCWAHKSEMRRSRTEALYELDTGFREEGWTSEEFVYNAEHDLYRFPDGAFAFSREYANERRLREMGCIG
jgi:hypothetical protein